MHSSPLRSSPTTPRTDFRDLETTKAAYAQALFRGDRFDVQAGLRYDSTHLLIDTNQPTTAAATAYAPTRRTTDYAYWLPSALATYQLDEGMRVRAGVSKTIGRPDYSQYAARTSFGIGTDGSTLTINTGNPDRSAEPSGSACRGSRTGEGGAVIVALARLCGSAAPALAGSEQPVDTVHADTVQIVLKFVKRGSGDTPVARFDPASCASCTPVTTPLFNAENARETVIALTVPSRRSLELAFQGQSEAVRRVILEGGDLPFRYEAGRIVVQLPPVASDAVTAAEVPTHIVEPGMVLRFEHADPARRAGFYATGAFPDVQRRAANVLEFAQRKVVRELGLGEQVEREHLERVQIMGFDTNAPHNHIDAPPHMHMHLRWRSNTGTQIGHYYIGADGLLTYNQVGVKDIPGRERRFGRGEPFTTAGPNGHGIYTHRITTEGWLELGRAGETPCLIQPDGGAGFQSGATVRCAGHLATRIAVEDDRSRGIVTVTTGNVTETFRYDTDTVALISPAVVAPPGPSVYQDGLANTAPVD